MPGKSGGYLVQSTFGAGGKGNFEVVLPVLSGPGGLLGHYFRDNSAPSFPWHGPGTFGGGGIDTASLIESTFGNLEVVAVSGNKLLHLSRSPAGTWSAPAVVANGVTGMPGFIQNTQGSPGNFEVVVPLAVGGLGHFFRDNSAAGFPWHGPGVFGGSGAFYSVSLIDCTFRNYFTRDFSVFPGF